MSEFANHPSAGFFRRMTVIVYDLLVAVALYMLVGAINFVFVYALFHFGLINHNGQSHFIDVIKVGQPWILQLMTLVNFAVIAHVFAWFWSHGGQTLGMRAWRLKITDEQGNDPSLQQAWLRLLFSIGGLGNLMALVGGNSMQDHIAKTRMIMLTKEENIMRNWKQN